MIKDAIIRARTQSDLLKEVEVILEELGISKSEAINLFFRQIKLHKGIPFTINIPNETTIETFQDTDNNKNIVECEDLDDMFNKLEM